MMMKFTAMDVELCDEIIKLCSWLTGWTAGAAGGQGAVIVGDDADLGDAQWGLFVAGTSLAFQVGTVSASIVLPNVATGTPEHISGVFKNGEACIYVGGVQAECSDNSAPTTLDSTTVVFGEPGISSMSIDEFKLWNRALSEAELTGEIHAFIETEGLLMRHTLNAAASVADGAGTALTCDFPASPELSFGKSTAGYICSGAGTCGEDNKCDCEDDRDGLFCEERVGAQDLLSNELVIGTIIGAASLLALSIVYGIYKQAASGGKPKTYYSSNKVNPPTQQASGAAASPIPDDPPMPEYVAENPTPAPRPQHGGSGTGRRRRSSSGGRKVSGGGKRHRSRSGERKISGSGTRHRKGSGHGKSGGHKRKGSTASGTSGGAGGRKGGARRKPSTGPAMPNSSQLAAAAFGKSFGTFVPSLNKSDLTTATAFNSDTTKLANTFDALIAVLSRDNFALVIGMEPHVETLEMDNFASALIELFEYRRRGYDLVKWAVQSEIRREDGMTGLFRAGTLNARLIAAYLKLTGVVYLDSLVTRVVRSLVSSPTVGTDYEVDPSLTKSQSAVIAALARLRSLLGAFTDRFSSSIAFVPTGMRDLALLLQAEVGRKHGAAEDVKPVLSTLIFHRWIGPALVSPASHGLIKDEPSTEAVRALTTVSKLIQNASSGTKFFKEAHMIPLNDAVEASTPRFHAFFEGLWTSKGGAQALPAIPLSEKEALFAVGHLEYQLSETEAFVSDTIDKASPGKGKALVKDMRKAIKDLGSVPAVRKRRAMSKLFQGRNARLTMGAPP